MPVVPTREPPQPFDQWISEPETLRAVIANEIAQLNAADNAPTIAACADRVAGLVERNIAEIASVTIPRLVDAISRNEQAITESKQNIAVLTEQLANARLTIAVSKMTVDNLRAIANE